MNKFIYCVRRFDEHKILHIASSDDKAWQWVQENYPNARGRGYIVVFMTEIDGEL